MVHSLSDNPVQVVGEEQCAFHGVVFPLAELEDDVVVAAAVRSKGLHDLCPLHGHVGEHGECRNHFHPCGNLPKRGPHDL